jgi:hypothetical protein
MRIKRMVVRTETVMLRTKKMANKRREEAWRISFYSFSSVFTTDICEYIAEADRPLANMSRSHQAITSLFGTSFKGNC